MVDSYKNLELVKNTRKTLELCNVAPTEKIVLYTDTGRNQTLVDAFFASAISMEADVSLVVTTPKPLLEDLSPLVSTMMMQSNLVIDLATNPWLYTKTMNDLLAGNVRVLGVLASEDAVARRPPTEGIVRLGEAAAKLLTNRQSVKVTSKNGTDYTVSGEGRPGYGQDGVVRKPGEWDNTSTSILAFAPLEDSMNGTVVVAPGDTMYFHPNKFIAASTTTLHVADGRITKIEGSSEARLLEGWLKGFDDPNAFVVSHTGFGGDQRASMASMDPLDWESHRGGVNIAFGSNMFRLLQGKNASKAHVDIVLQNANLSADGEDVILDGNIIHPNLIRP
jgi:2,5-dihydroxypyridine 5,6-dioxygenase